MNSTVIQKLLKNAFTEKIQSEKTASFIKNLCVLNDYSILSKNGIKNADQIASCFYKELLPFASKVSPSKVKNSASQFFEIVLNFNWQFYAGRKEVVENYSKLILQMISFDPKLLGPIFARLVDFLNNKRVKTDQFDTKIRTKIGPKNDLKNDLKICKDKSIEKTSKIGKTICKKVGPKIRSKNCSKSDSKKDSKNDSKNDSKIISIDTKNGLKNDLNENGFEEIKMIHNNVHNLIGEICNLLPFSLQDLFLALVKGFPFKMRDKFTIVSYVKNLLRVLEYASVLSDRIVALIFRKIYEIDIDVSFNFDCSPDSNIFYNFISTHLVSFSDEVSEFIKSHLLKNNIENNPNREQILETESVKEKRLEMKEKLEEIMILLFKYFDSVKNDRELIDKIFSSIIITFESEVLKNRAVKNTPFVVFYLASFSNSFTERLIRFLMQRLDRTLSLDVKRNTIAFLAGLLVHSNFVNSLIITTVFNHFLKMAIEILNKCEPSKMINSTESHNDTYHLFFSLCESIFYLFIHRYNEISASSDYEETKAPLSRIVCSKMSPLQYCAQEVVLAFTAFSFAVHAVDCFPVLLCNFRFFRRDKSNVLQKRSGFLDLGEKQFFDRKRADLMLAKTNLEGIAVWIGDFWITEKKLNEKIEEIFETSLEGEPGENTESSLSDDEDLFGLEPVGQFAFNYSPESGLCYGKIEDE